MSASRLSGSMAGPFLHGEAPYTVALLHGGPGSIGDMAPVARELCLRRGVLEPWGTAGSLAGQLGDLERDIEAHARSPVTLAGHSWGATLAYLFATRHPDAVSKLILIDAPPFEERYEEEFCRTRDERLTEQEREELSTLFEELARKPGADGRSLRARIDALMARVYAFDPLPETGAGEKPDPLPSSRFRRAWSELSRLRRSGRLLAAGRKLRCPVVAIHGEYDPLPLDGVETPLRTVVPGLRVHVLLRCGHTPWKERQAREAFLRLLEEELEPVGTAR